MKGYFSVNEEVLWLHKKNVADLEKIYTWCRHNNNFAQSYELMVKLFLSCFRSIQIHRPLWILFIDFLVSKIRFVSMLLYLYRMRQ